MPATPKSAPRTASARTSKRPRTRADLVQATLDAVRELDLATSRFRAATAQAWHVTVTDSLVMSNLAVAGGEMTPRDLGRRLMISSGTLTSMLDRLESHGFVARAPNPDDRRSLLITLTDSGRESLFYSSTSIQTAVAGALPAGSSTQIVDTMLAIAAALNTAAEDIGTD